MQIAFCIFKYFPHGGIPRDMMKIVRECLVRGHRVRVYAGRWEGEHPEGIEVIELPAMALAGHQRYQRFAARALDHLRRHPVDLVVGMNKMPGLDVYYAGDSCFEEKARTQRGALYRLLPRYRHFARFERAVFEPDAGTEILTISDVEVPCFRRHYATPPERFHPLPPGIDPDRRAPPDRDAVRQAFRAELGIGDDEHLLLFLGSGFIKKGLDRVLVAFRALPPDLYRSTRLFVVGHDRAEPFQRLARRLGILERIRFFAGRDDVPRFLFGADALVLPAYDENAGMVILEAMIAGLPALVTANCGYAHYVRDADAGLVADLPFDQQAFDRQLVEVLTSRERARWRANGLALAQDPGIYRLAPTAVDYLEAFAARRRPRSAADEPYLRADLAALWAGSDVFERVRGLEGEVYRAVATRRTLRFEAGGRAYFAKIHWATGWGEILKNLLTLRLPVTGARNEYEACRHLQQAGVEAPIVAGFGERGRNPARRFSFVICDALEGRDSLEDVVADWQRQAPLPAQKRRLLLAVARFAAALHGAGVVHRDFYICHLLLDRAGWQHGRVDLAVIDLHRARIYPRIPAKWLRRDLAALLYSVQDAPLTRRDWLRFLAAYRGRPWRQVLADERDFWESVHRRAAALYRKGRRKGLVAGAGAVRAEDGSVHADAAADGVRRAEP